MSGFEHERDRNGYRINIRHPMIAHIYAVYCDNHGVNFGWVMPRNKRLDFELRVLQFRDEIINGENVDEYFIR